MNRRVPRLNGVSRLAMRQWFGAMAKENLLFHPDNAAEDLVQIDTGLPTFNQDECVQVNQIMTSLFEANGDMVYDEAMYQFQKLVRSEAHT